MAPTVSHWDNIGNMATADTRLNIRIPADLKRAIQVQAAKEGRTMANLVIRAMREYLEKGGK